MQGGNNEHWLGRHLGILLSRGPSIGYPSKWIDSATRFFEQLNCKSNDLLEIINDTNNLCSSMPLFHAWLPDYNSVVSTLGIHFYILYSICNLAGGGFVVFLANRAPLSLVFFSAQAGVRCWLQEDYGIPATCPQTEA